MESESLHDAAVEAGADLTHDAAHAVFYEDPKFWVAIAFVLFVILAAKYIWPAIGRALDKRGDAIRDQLEAANRLQAEAEALLATYRDAQAKALSDAQAIVALATRDAEIIRAKAAEELKLTLARRSEQAAESIRREQSDAMRQMRAQLVDAATLHARSVLATQLASEKNDPAFARALEAIEENIH